MRRRRRRHCCLHTTHTFSPLWRAFVLFLSLRRSSFAEGQLFLIRIYNLLSGSTLYTRRWLLPALCTCSWNNKGFVKNNEAFTGRKSDHYCCLLRREWEFGSPFLLFSRITKSRQLSGIFNSRAKPAEIGSKYVNMTLLNTRPYKFMQKHQQQG